MSIFFRADFVIGLGLAVVVRIVEQLGGQLRVDSRVDDGSRFSFLLPFSVADPNSFTSRDVAVISPEDGSASGPNSEIDSLVSAISASHMVPHAPSTSPRPVPRRPRPRKVRPPSEGKFEVEDSVFPVRPLKVDDGGVEPPMVPAQKRLQEAHAHRVSSKPLQMHIQRSHQLRILIVGVRLTGDICTRFPFLIANQHRTILSMPKSFKSVSGLMVIMWPMPSTDKRLSTLFPPIENSTAS
jgi:hypothetical protein